jgi:hypothetical protein
MRKKSRLALICKALFTLTAADPLAALTKEDAVSMFKGEFKVIRPINKG